MHWITNLYSRNSRCDGKRKRASALEIFKIDTRRFSTSGKRAEIVTSYTCHLVIRGCIVGDDIKNMLFCISFFRKSELRTICDQDWFVILQGRSQVFSKGGSHCVKVRVLTRLSLWRRYRHGIFATCSRLFG